MLPHSERRELVAGLQLEGPVWRMASFGEPARLLAATRDQDLEGVVAAAPKLQARSARYRPCGEPK